MRSEQGPDADPFSPPMQIVRVLGTDDFHAYLEKYEIDLDPELDEVLTGRWQRRPWSRFVTTENQRYISNESIDFLDKLLRYDHQERLTAAEAQEHPYFEPVKTAAANGDIPPGTT